MNKHLVCIDSDGCAMDTMTIKHLKCFGPCMVEEWGLEEYKQPILDKWNDINLYTKTRGINRFKGLVKILEFVNENYREIDDIKTLRDWTIETPALSENALRERIAKGSALILEKALSWSIKTNLAIDALLPEEKKAFKYVRESILKAKENCDIAIVSSANRKAMEEEWNREGLMPYISHCLAQDSGTKEICLKKLKELGYESILMVGDALGDLEAARNAGVLFYPILCRSEEESWQEFYNDVVEEFLNDEYQQDKYIDGFIANLE